MEPATAMIVTKVHLACVTKFLTWIRKMELTNAATMSSSTNTITISDTGIDAKSQEAIFMY